MSEFSKCANKYDWSPYSILYFSVTTVLIIYTKVSMEPFTLVVEILTRKTFIVLIG